MLHSDFKRHWKRQKRLLIEALYKIRLHHLQIASKYTIERISDMTGAAPNSVWNYVDGMNKDDPY